MFVQPNQQIPLRLNVTTVELVIHTSIIHTLNYPAHQINDIHGFFFCCVLII